MAGREITLAMDEWDLRDFLAEVREVFPEGPPHGIRRMAHMVRSAIYGNAGIASLYPPQEPEG